MEGISRAVCVGGSAVGQPPHRLHYGGQSTSSALREKLQILSYLFRTSAIISSSAVRAGLRAAEAGGVERGIGVFSEPIVPHRHPVLDVLRSVPLELSEGRLAGWKEGREGEGGGLGVWGWAVARSGVSFACRSFVLRELITLSDRHETYFFSV